jgi:hypothetical protein
MNEKTPRDGAVQYYPFLPGEAAGFQEKKDGPTKNERR